MVDKISVQIALEGGKEIEKQLADIGAAGQKAFEDISKSAEQVGGFKNLKPEEVTKKLEDLGVTGKESIDKIQAAVKSAGQWETLVTGVAAVETGLLAVAKAAAVVGTAVAAAVAALSRYTSEAAKMAEALAPLADVSGQTSQSISALQIVFAQGGTSAAKFAQSFTELELKVAEASRTMAADVEASSQRIVRARMGVAQAGVSVQAAELALREAELRAAGRTDAEISARTASQRRQLALEQAEQGLAAARQQQQEAAHTLRVAEANDLQKNIELYQQMAAGQKVSFDALTTGETKAKALADALAKAKEAGADYTATLADIVKNASAVERIDIQKALKLDDASLEKLKQGGAALRAQKQAVDDLGIALNDVDRTKLKAFSDSWSMLGATASAALEKLGAALAPIGTLIAQGLQIALEFVIQEVQKLAADFGIFGNQINTIATAGAQVLGTLVEAVKAVGYGIGVVIETLGGITWDSFGSAGAAAWNTISDAVQGTIGWIKSAYDWLLKYLGLRSEGAPAPSSGDTGSGGGEGMARGGLLGGRGTGTSDSNLAWVSRGEHIMPARAVAQPGVLAFLEALRHSGGNLSRVLDGMGRFALGGMVPRAMPAFASGGLAGGMSNVTIQFPGLPAIGGLRASSDVVDQLHKAAALAQVRSGGRKPSRYS